MTEGSEVVGVDGLREIYSRTLHTVHASFRFRSLEEQDVRNIIHKIKIISVGADGITAGMVKLCCPINISCVTHTINLSTLVFHWRNFAMFENQL